MEICKWKYNANSPVLFMIDDLCNAWVDLNGNGKIDLEEDFGAGLNEENSSFRFLEQNILKKFPWVKVNFYVPVGKRIGMLRNSKIQMYSNPITDNKKCMKFFENINNNERYELSYHGITHGEVFEKSEDQKQEWECYKTLEEAIEKIKIGKEIFKKAVGKYPKGGKYCGYIGGKYGDKSINETGFLWWHRFWNKGIENIGGYEKDPLKAYDIVEFGDKNVIDIPSTVIGGLFNLKSKCFFKTTIKYILRSYIKRKKKKELEFLLTNKLVISIQEHICPARDDGKRQTPNIFDDKNSLIEIFNFLKTKNVWYCTGTELAEYYYLRKNLRVEKNEENFNFNLKNINKVIENNEISLKIDIDYKKIKLPNNKIIEIKNKIVTLPIMIGNYSFIK